MLSRLVVNVGVVTVLTLFPIIADCKRLSGSDNLAQQAQCYDIADKYIRNFNKTLINNDTSIVMLPWKAHYNSKLNTCFATEDVIWKHNGKFDNRYIFDILKDKLLFMMTYGAKGKVLYNVDSHGPSAFPDDYSFDAKVKELFEGNK